MPLVKHLNRAGDYTVILTINFYADFKAVLTRLDKLSDVLERGKRAQQKKVLGMLFESVSIDGAGTIKEVELQKWARPLFADLLIVNGDHKCPQGNSNPCRRLERAVS